MPKSGAGRIYRDVEEAIDFAHEKGALHDNLVAEDIWVRMDGRIVIAGLGGWRERGDQIEHARTLERLRLKLQGAVSGEIGCEAANDSELSQWVVRLGGPRSATDEFVTRCREHLR